MEALKNLSRSTNDPLVATEHLQQINNYIQSINTKDLTQIDQTLEFLFPKTNDDDGILGYLRGTLGKKEKGTEKCKVEALKIIQRLLNPREKQSLIKVAQNLIWPKCEKIMELMNLLWLNQNESARVKVEAIENIILILDYFKDRTMASDFKLATLYRDMLTASDKSITPSVKGKIFQCLGVVASFGLKSYLSKEVNRLQLSGHFINTIKSQVESGHRLLEASIILGCIKGLDKYLKSLLEDETKTPEEQNQLDNRDSELQTQLHTFYEKLEQIIDPKISIECNDKEAKLKRREFQRAGLEFLANHGNFFRETFLKKYEVLYNDLLPWAKSSNALDSRVGVEAMKKFLEALFRNRVDKPNVIQYFITTFSRILDNKGCNRSELTTAIFGSGLLASSCTPPMIEQLFTKIVKQIEAITIELSTPVTDKYSSPLSLIPTYLESVGKMLILMDTSDEHTRQLFQNRLQIIENLSVLLMTSYPDLAGIFRSQAPMAFVSVINGLYSKHNKFCEPFLCNVIHEVCTHIIASPTTLERDLLIESLKQEQATTQDRKSPFTKINTVTNYTYFWIKLLNDASDDLSTSSTGLSPNPKVIELIYNTFLEWILKTIGKLDLSLTFVDVENDDDTIENTAVDLVYGTKATMIKDFQLFYNIETLLQEVVGKCEKTHLFSAWVEIFVEKILSYIKENQLVSGFYRIMALVFEQTRKLDYFGAEENEETFTMCCKFLQQTSVQMKDFRDDLLISILEIWLAVPDQLILNSHLSIGNTLECVFRMGKNSFHLAMKGIKAIERWFQINEFPEEEMEQIFNRLFSIWKSYFTTTDITEEEEIEKAKTDPKYKSSSNLAKKKSQAVGREIEKNPTLGIVQRKLLRLMGSYAHLIDADIEDLQSGFSTEAQFLKYAVPFRDIKPDIYLDNFIPRILDLCLEGGGDRQLRVSACEVLYSFVSYFLGCYAKQSRSSPQSLCNRLLNALVNLGCDSDLVVRQLFNPLCIQTIRWSTSTEELADTTLRVIIDGLVQSEDSAKRDFSGICLQEYFENCLKISARKAHAKKVLKYVITLSEHASAKYRQGSALGFNSIYKTYREDRELSPQFALQLLCSFIVNLSLSEEFEEISLLISSTKRAITRMERIILKDQDILNTPMNTRKIPSDMRGSTLKDLIDWLLKKSQDSSACCRKECFRLIKNFAPKLRKISNLENYLNTLNPVDLKSMTEHQCEDYIKQLEISSDFYLFLHESNYPVDLIITSENSKFLQLLTTFLNNFKSPAVEDYASLNNDTYEFYSKALKVFYSVGSLLVRSSLTELSGRLIELSVLTSRSLHDKNDIDIKDIVSMWKNTWRNCNGELLVKLQEMFKLDLSDEYLKVNRVIWLKKVAQYGFFSEIWDTEMVSSLLTQIWTFIDHNLFEVSRSGIEERVISYKTKNLLQALFDLALQLRENGDVIVEKLFDRTIVNQHKKVKSTKGEVLQKIFLQSLPYCEEMLDFQRLISKQSLGNVGQLVQNLLVVIKNKKELRKQFGETVVKNTIKIWTQISLNCSPSVVSSLISALASLDMKACRNSKELADWWCGPDIMRNVNSKTLKEKSEFIHFFGLFCLSKNQEIVSKVMSTLLEVLKEILHPGVVWEDEGSYAVKILYAVLTTFEEIPTNPQILELILMFVNNVFEISSVKNPCCSSARNKLIQVIGRIQNSDHEQRIVEKLYALILGRNQPYFRSSIATTKYCLIPVISSMSERAVTSFYLKHVNDIIDKSKIEAVSTEDWILKISAVTLLESLVLLKTKKPFFGGMQLTSIYISNLVKRPETNDPKQLAKDIIASSKFKDVSSQSDERIRKLVFLYNRSAYNTRIAVMRKIEAKPDFALKLGVLLKPNDAWSSIIDSQLNYNFPVLIEKGPISEGEETDTTANVIVKGLVSNSRTSRKLALATSSLAVDATNYDFTAAVSVDNSKYYQKIFANVDANSTKGSENKEAESSHDWNQINSHECMTSFTSLLCYAAEKHPEEFASKWIKEIKNLLESQDNKITINTKLFFCGAILKSKDIFKQYASELTETIIGLIIHGDFGPVLNYFMKDILIMLIEWTDLDSISKPSSDLTSKLLDFVVPLIYHERNDLHIQNLKLLEAVVNRWAADSKIPYDVIETILQDKPKSGLMICKAILRGGRIPCNHDKLRQLLAMVRKCFSDSSKGVYSLSGDVAGLILRKLAEMNFHELGRVIEKVVESLDKEMKKSQPQSFLTILLNIQKSFPEIIKESSYKMKVFELFKNNALKADALDVIPGMLTWELKCKENEPYLERKVCAESLFSDLEGRGFFRTSNKSDQEIKSTVKILEEVVDYLEEPKLLTIVNQLEKVESSADIEVKSKYAGAISKIYFKFGGRRENSILSIRALKIFVKLYKDSDDEKMKEIVNKFWKETLQSWENSSTLILELFEILADSQHSIPISVDLIIKKCEESPEYMKDIFPEPLSRDCLYETYDLNTSWRVKSTYQPMFAESFSASQHVPNFPSSLKSAVFTQRQGTIGMNVLKSMGAGKSRYTPTAADGNWNESMPMEVDSFGGSFNENDFYANLNDKSHGGKSEEDSIDVLADLRKKFYELPPSQISDNRYYARKELERQDMLVAKSIESIREKKGGIKLSRTYRIGDLPDIMMKNSEFLSTISSLIKMDEELGRKFLVNLFTHFLNEMRGDKDKYCQTASECFNNILEKYGNSEEMSPHFAGTLLEISTVNDMILIKPNLVSDVALNYHLEKLSIFKFENILESMYSLANATAKDAKRGRFTNRDMNEEADTLLRIVEQYKELEEFDVIKNLLYMAGSTESESAEAYNQGAKALTFENEGKFADALELYSTLYNSEVEENYNKRRAMFWDCAVYKCLKHLSNWEDMYERADQFFRGNSSQDFDFDYVQFHRITSACQVLIRDQSEEDEEPEVIGHVRQFFEDIQKDEDGWLQTCELYPMDLAVVRTIVENDETAHILELLKKSSETLLESFKFYDKVSRSQKKENLLTAQRSSVLYDYLDWFREKDHADEELESATIHLISKWRHIGRSKKSPLVNLDIVGAQKDNFLVRMGITLEDRNMDSKDELVGDLKCLSYEQNLWLAELSILNGNSELANKTLQKAEDIGMDLEDGYQLQRQRLYCEQLLAFGEEIEDQEWINVWTRGWKNANDTDEENSTTLLEIKAQLLQSLVSKLWANRPFSYLDALKKELKISKSSKLENFSVNETKALSQLISSETVTSGSLYMKVYNLLKIIRKKCEGSFSKEENDDLQKEMAVNLLNGMVNADSEALHLFPSLFPILEKHPDFISAFKQHTENVPTWMFLPWIDQIIGNLNRCFGQALNHVVDRLANEYPQAFQLQYPQLHSKKKFPELFKVFADSLNAIVIPSILFKEYISKDVSSIHPSNTNAFENCCAFENKLKEIENTPHIYGDIHATFAKKVTPKLKLYMDALSERQSNLESSEEMLDLDDSTYVNKWKEFCQFAEKAEGKTADFVELKRLSPWIHKFRSSAFQDYLEIPGLYSKFEKPNKSLHPMIVSFHSIVQVLPSITKPIKITITANNGKEVRFLVKKGDDLKQDKRIQQCFRIVNEIFKHDSFCRTRRMQISTYSVVPVSSNFGIIEWIDNCRSLKELICTTPDQKQLYNTSVVSFGNYLKSKYTPDKHDTSFKFHYHIFAEKVGKSEAEKLFNLFKSKFPGGLLKKHVTDGCSSLEDFFDVRMELIRSYASMSFVHWLLGIGDRHLENVLVNTKTGKFLGIDFGRAFGWTISRQYVPEFVPFRLTPQIENFLSPYGSKGLFKETMLHAKRSLTKSSDLIEAVVDIFVQDPLVDWIKNVKSNKEMPIEEINGGMKNFNPIEILNMKLQGKNPLHIIDKDIQSIHEEGKRKVYSRILKSGKDSLLTIPELPDEEYVDALIDIAQDKNILARMYEGWASWI